MVTTFSTLPDLKNFTSDIKILLIDIFRLLSVVVISDDSHTLSLSASSQLLEPGILAAQPAVSHMHVYEISNLSLKRDTALVLHNLRLN